MIDHGDNDATKRFRELAMEQVEIDERDLATRQSLIALRLEETLPIGARRMLLALKRQVDGVIRHGMGDGVQVFLDHENKVKSTVTYGRSRYAYVSNVDRDNNVLFNTNYDELIIELIGMIKDKEISIAELFYRRNWSFETGDVMVDQPDITYLVGEAEYQAKDKDALAMIVDTGDLSVESYMDLIASTRVKVDTWEGKGENRLIIQDRLSKAIRGIKFTTLESVVDTMLHHMLIKIEVVQ